MDQVNSTAALQVRLRLADTTMMCLACVAAGNIFIAMHLGDVRRQVTLSPWRLVLAIHALSAAQPVKNPQAPVKRWVRSPLDPTIVHVIFLQQEAILAQGSKGP